MNKHSNNIFVMNMMIIIYVYMYYMSISKLWYQQDSKSKRVTFVAKLPNKWLFYFPHHLFLEEGSQVPKDFAKSQTATMEAILLKEFTKLFQQLPW